MSHCVTCCERYGLGVRLVGKGIELALAYWAVSWFDPGGWPFWKEMAAAVILVGLWR